MLVKSLGWQEDKKQAKNGQEVVLKSDINWLVLLYYCFEYEAYLIVQYTAVPGYNYVKWHGIRYDRASSISIAMLTDDSPAYNWSQIYELIGDGVACGI